MRKPMRLHEKYRPKSLADVIGQPDVIPLREFARNPYPCCLLLEGPTGVGKTTCARALTEELGCYRDAMFESAYFVTAANFDAETVRYYFGPESPFRFRCPGWHVLILEELETMNKTVQRQCKDLLEREVNRRRLVVVATSNDSSGLPKAVRHRFKHYWFDGGPSFAEACLERLSRIWAREAPAGAELPPEWMTWGWEEDRTSLMPEFSMRLALDKMQDVLDDRRETLREKFRRAREGRKVVA